MEEPLDRLIDLLARLIADGDLTEAQAESIIRYWRDKEQAELARLLSLPVAQGVGDDDEMDPPVVFLLPAVTPRRERVRMLDTLQDAHAADVARLSEALETGRLTVAQWQRSIRATNVQLFSDAITLAGATSAAIQRRLAAIEAEQAAYLQRFADQVSARRLAQPVPAAAFGAALAAWTAAYLAHRAAMYSGAGRALYYAATEGGGAGGYGWIVRYEAQDDDRACSPCLDAQGYYLLGQGPMPGDVCLGGGYCRCTRVAVYDVARYLVLVGV